MPGWVGMPPMAVWVVWVIGRRGRTAVRTKWAGGGGPDSRDPAGASGVGAGSDPLSVGAGRDQSGAGPVQYLSGVVAHGLVVAEQRRRRRADYRRWERGRPMELWQLDVVGGFHLCDGTEVKAVSGIDDNSRFICLRPAGVAGDCEAGV